MLALGEREGGLGSEVAFNHLQPVAWLLQCGSMATPSKRQALKRHGSLNATPEAIRAESFTEHPEFFDPEDKLQVRYEMLRAPSKGEMTVSQACRDFAVSRQSF